MCKSLGYVFNDSIFVQYLRPALRCAIRDDNRGPQKAPPDSRAFGTACCPTCVEDVKQKTWHEFTVHLRGAAMDEVQQLFDEHVKSKDSMSNERPKKARNSTGDDPAVSALADTVARNTFAAQTRVRFWG